MKVEVGESIIELVRGDITKLATDAIVNAANGQLVMGGGVAGAILRAGGEVIQQECNEKAPINVGEAAITTAGRLPARYVIHAVGPRQGEGDEDTKLANATMSSLKLTDQHNLKSIAFPAISAGIFGYPIDRCAEVMLSTAIDYLKGDSSIEKVIFCLYSDNAFRVFEEELKKR